MRKKSVEEPGALTPTFLPARSLIDLISALCEGDTTSTSPGIAVVDHERLQLLLLGGEIDAVVEIAGDHVGAAAEHGLERVRAALQIDQFDRKPRLVEFAKLLGQHGRQIAQAGAAADGDGDLALRRREIGHQEQRQQRRGKPAKNRPHGFLRTVHRWAHDRAARAP